MASECATWLLSFGAEVTLLVRGSAVLKSAEPFAGEMVARHLSKRGADVRFGTTVHSVSRPDARDTGEGNIHGGPVTIETSSGVIEVDELIVAAGRAPTSTHLGLSSIGLTDGAYVPTDDHLCAQGEWLYAVGDINGRSPLTHMGKYQARVCGDVIAARAASRALVDPRFIASADNGRVPRWCSRRPKQRGWDAPKSRPGQTVSTSRSWRSTLPSQDRRCSVTITKAARNW